MFIRSALLSAATVLALSTAAMAGNTSNIIQSGDDNGARVSQRGHSNDSQSIQIGDRNSLGVRQRGANNNVGGGQTGNHNKAKVQQSQN